jgi:elongin-C
MSLGIPRSAEGHVFHLERKCAVVSGTIRAMLAGEFKESGGEIRFPELSTAILERVIQYFHYKVKWSNSTTPPPDFSIEPEYALDLLMAANYLDC